MVGDSEICCVSFWGRIYAVKIGTSHWREKVIKSVATQTVSNLCMHPPSYPSKVSNKNAKVSSTQQFKQAWATITRSSSHDRTRTKSWIFHQVTSPRCMIHVFKLGTSDNDPMPRQSLYVSRHLIFSRESRVWNPTCRTIPRPPAATQIPSHLGRFPKGSLYDPIHLFNPTHGQVVCQGQKLAGEGVWQGTHHGAHDLSWQPCRRWKDVASLQVQTWVVVEMWLIQLIRPFAQINILRPLCWYPCSMSKFEENSPKFQVRQSFPAVEGAWPALIKRPLASSACKRSSLALMVWPKFREPVCN